MNRARFLLLAVTVAFAACGGGAMQTAEPAPPPAPEHVDPTGDWEVVFTVEGQPVDGMMTVTGSREAGYEGYIETGMGGAAVRLEVEYDEVRIIAPEVGAEVLCVMTEDGILEGELAGAMGGGTFWASRISGG